MKITNIKTIVTCPGRNYTLVKIETDQPGLYGWGDATLNGRELSVKTLIDEHITPLLLGKDADQIEDTWQYLYKAPYWQGGPVFMTALAGIDLALWDIKGKAAGLPVYQLFGGRVRAGAMAYSHNGGKTFEEVEQQVRKKMEMGFRVLRIGCACPGNKGGIGDPWNRKQMRDADGGHLPPQETWEPGPYLRTIPRLMEHMRNNLGDEIELLFDVHARLTPQQAAQLAKDVEPYRPFFLEDPLRPENLDGFRLIRQHATTPIAMGELFNTRYQALPLLTEQLIDFIRCDIGHIGGLSEARRIATIAEPFNIRTAWHGPGDIAPITHAANVHLDIASTNFGVQEMTFFSDQVKEVIPGGPTFDNGYLNVSDTPGLGTDVDEQLAAKYPYVRDYLPTTRRVDGAVHDW